jgi:twitching motility protein PilT
MAAANDQSGEPFSAPEKKAEPLLHPSGANSPSLPPTTAPAQPTTPLPNQNSPQQPAPLAQPSHPTTSPQIIHVDRMNINLEEKYPYPYLTAEELEKIAQPIPEEEENPYQGLKNPKDVRLGLDWKALVQAVQAFGATDILPCDRKIYMRIGGDVTCLSDTFPKKEFDDFWTMTVPYGRCQKELFGPRGSADFSCTRYGLRMRGNVFRSLNGLGGAFRPLPDKVPPKERLLIQESIIKVMESYTQGLILVTGPTGSGKSSTIIGLIDYMNTNYPLNIITLEDPVEFIFKSKKSTIHQREVGGEVDDFETGLRAAMRENPNIIVIGEVRDYATMKAMLKAAETGHMVFATLHTKRVSTTFDRLLNMAPAEDRDGMKETLAENTIIVLSQRLVKKKGGGLQPMREIYFNNTAGANAIKEGKTKNLNNVMQTGGAKGMQTWNQALDFAKKAGTLTEEEYNLQCDKTES